MANEDIAVELRHQAEKIAQRIAMQVLYRDNAWPNGLSVDVVAERKRAFDVRIEVMSSIRRSLLNRATRLERETGTPAPTTSGKER